MADPSTTSAGADPATRRAGPFSADVIPGVLFAVSLLFFAVRLDVPDSYVFDEVYHAYTAGQYAVGNPDAFVWNVRSPDANVAYMWNHPPAGVLMMTGGILLWGNNSFGWRFSSAVFGAAGIVIAYLLALRMTGRRRVAVTAAMLLLVDGLYFVQSRTGMLDIFGTVFMLGAFLALYAYLTAPPERIGGPLACTGVCLGLAIATKWNAGYASAIIGIVVVVRAFNLWRAGRAPDASPEPREAFRRHLVWIPLALGVVPLAIYLLAYVPFFATGHGLSEFVELQNQIFRYHTGLEETHTYQSSWWQWPLALRPVWYHATSDGETIANIYANGNPLLYWAFLPSVAWVAVRWWKRRPAACMVLLIGFFGQWLPWALVPRIAFVYHFLPAATFGALALAVVLAKLWSRGGLRRTLAVGYVLAVVLAFAFFYPIYAEVPITAQSFEHRMWLESWR